MGRKNIKFDADWYAGLAESEIGRSLVAGSDVGKFHLMPLGQATTIRVYVTGWPAWIRIAHAVTKLTNNASLSGILENKTKRGVV